MIKTLKEWKNSLSEKSGLTKKDCEVFYKAFGEVIQEEMAQNDSTEVSLPYVGRFKVTTRRDFTAKNPKTNDTVVVPVSKRITFKAYNSFKDKIC